MTDTLDAKDREEAVRGMSDSARKAKSIVPPPSSIGEAAEPMIVSAAGDVIGIYARQSEAIIRSWEETVSLSLDGFAVWTSSRDIWVKACQECLQSSFNAAQQTTKMMAQPWVQLFSRGVGCAAEPTPGRSE
jgi:hypothetical protein